ncbi:nectin-2-like [Carcharodon carcharias]|uniref:nectin-2-like n=1 Tax=Carcharodon carcharias TaxID=13397 RepID=UPI001B7EDAF2|nr:nectin-2-like [Carcharodon carcharias]
MKPFINLFLLSSVWLILITTAYVHCAVTVHTSLSVTGYKGQVVILPCSVTISDPGVKVVSVAWSSPAKEADLAVYHPRHGTSYPGETNSSRIHFRRPSQQDATLMINNSSKSDSGIYTCSWTTFPKGIFSSKTKLNISGCRLR